MAGDELFQYKKESYAYVSINYIGCFIGDDVAHTCDDVEGG